MLLLNEAVTRVFFFVHAHQQTALHLSAHTQQTDMIKKLLVSGASLHITDHKGNTPLHIAAKFSSTKVLEEIVRYVPLQKLLEVSQVRNNDGLTCIHVAATHSNTDTLRKLRSLSMDINMQVCTHTIIYMYTAAQLCMGGIIVIAFLSKWDTNYTLVGWVCYVWSVATQTMLWNPLAL